MYRSIVVGTDGSRLADPAVERAAVLARGLGARLHVVSAHREPIRTSPVTCEWGPVGRPDIVEMWSQEALEHHRHRVASICDGVARGGVDVVGHVERGDACRVLCCVAREVGAQLIVVGDRHTRGVGRLFGSIPLAVTRTASVPVMVVRTQRAPRSIDAPPVRHVAS